VPDTDKLETIREPRFSRPGPAGPDGSGPEQRGDGVRVEMPDQR
jgi:hypothetical protein